MDAFWSSQFANDITNFLGGPVQTIEGLSGLALFVTLRHHLFCSYHRCLRLARATHQPTGLRLCHRHHPDLPDHGRIAAEHFKPVARD